MTLGVGTGMRKPLFRPWTPEDDERIRRLVANGVSINRAAAAFNRTRGSVYDRARKIGCPFPLLAETLKKSKDIAAMARNNDWWTHRHLSRLRDE